MTINQKPHNIRAVYPTSIKKAGENPHQRHKSKPPDTAEACNRSGFSDLSFNRLHSDLLAETCTPFLLCLKDNGRLLLINLYQNDSIRNNKSQQDYSDITGADLLTAIIKVL